MGPVLILGQGLELPACQRNQASPRYKVHRTQVLCTGQPTSLGRDAEAAKGLSVTLK